MTQMDLLFTILLTLTFFCASEFKVLNDYIQHYEEINYDTDVLHQRHLRHKRSADNTKDHVYLAFDAFGRNFNLRLKRDTSMFAPDHKLKHKPDGTLESVDLSFLYSGTLTNVPGSKVNGAIISGMFRGTIEIPGDTTYYLEPSKQFFDNRNPATFHSVIYRADQMNLDPYRDRRERERREAGLSENGMCGNDLAKDYMRSVLESEVVDRKTRSAMEFQEVYTENRDSGYHMYSKSANHQRYKRETLPANADTCTLYLRADPILWRHMVQTSGGNKEVAREEILALFASHVKAAFDIYTKTRFDNPDHNLVFQGVKFAVQRTQIMTDETEKCDDPLNRGAYCADNIDVSNFLNLNSRENHEEFCLAYVFTYRDFSKGTLGLAWVGSPGTASGGICEKWKEFNEGGKRVYKSLNTGVVTTLNYGKAVASRVSSLTFAHEMGHNFGSPHDTGPDCAPYGTSRADASQGNYIMFASATMGDKPHNSLFSECSKHNMSLVLDAVIAQNNGKRNCFTKYGAAFCGNGIKEENEECDCGYADSAGDCPNGDNCCWAKESSQVAESQFCMRKAGAVCSKSDGICCDENTCTPVGKAHNITCRYATECADASYCQDNTAVCPEPVHKPNGTYCNNYGFVCIEGECAGSLCEKFNFSECFVTGPTETVADKQRLCRLACQDPNTMECINSDAREKVENIAGYREMVDEVIANRKTDQTRNVEDGIELAAGSPCDNFQGYCDVFSRCRGVDADGPLSRLKNLIFSEETLATIRDWIVSHWWAVLLMAVGLVLAMGLFIKFCAVHTPSSNPKAKPARKLSETMTLRRRRNQHQQQPQSQPVRYPQSQGLLGEPQGAQGPPPPYPGPSMAGAPPHGHGKKGRGKHKGKGKDMELQGRV